jgi:hypothetical protein
MIGAELLLKFLFATSALLIESTVADGRWKVKPILGVCQFPSANWLAIGFSSIKMMV